MLRMLKDNPNLIGIDYDYWGFIGTDGRAIGSPDRGSITVNRKYVNGILAQESFIYRPLSDKSLNLRNWEQYETLEEAKQRQREDIQ